ncbi:unnamed protein product [Bathycoccus prasinos]
MMLRTSLSSSSSVLSSPSLPLRRRKSKSRGVFVNSSTSRDNRYETSFSSSSASGVRGVAANSFPRDDDDDDVEEVVHTVAPGDSLYGVAMSYDVDPRDLIAANAKTLGGFEYVLPGQRLVVPGRRRGGGLGGQQRQQHQSRTTGMKNLAPNNNGNNISSSVVVGQQHGGGVGAMTTTTAVARMPTIVTAVSFVFGLAFGLFLFSRERE